MTTHELLEAYRRMQRIRSFEQRVSVLYQAGRVPGFVHLSIGQEATAVGACWSLRPTDVITSTHRGHGHCLARGVDLLGMLAELMGRDSGICRGRGGSMHIADRNLGMFGANGIVGAGLPIAAGAAFAARYNGNGDAVIAFFGDGAAAQGAFHEAVNLAALWHLPVIFCCENNGYAEFTPFERQHPVLLAERALGYGIPHMSVDGNDVEAVCAVATDALSVAREGGGPVLLECTTYRWRGHYEGDPESYRTKDEVAAWKDRDPLVITGHSLARRGVATTQLEQLVAEVEEEVDNAVAQAEAAPPPDPATVSCFVTVPRATPHETPAPDGGEVFRTMDAVRLALAHEIESRPDVFLAGIDVGAGGNIFGLTRGLYEQWPDRVLDTPISETAIIGLAIGAAMAGLRPVVEIMYLDFIGVCFDQLLNQAAKLRYMTGGAVELPLTVRTQFGAGRSSAAQHSQSLEALLAHVPGLTVVMPSTPADTYGLLRAAIADPNPVIFIEHRLLYGHKGPRPPEDHLVPLGTARVVRQGKDVTVVTVSRMVHECVAAAEILAADGIDIEIIDLRTVAPLDREAILGSLRRTGRLVVAHEAVRDFGIGAEIAALVAEDGFWHLDVPIQRVGALPTPAPYAPSLEERWLPDREQIIEAVRIAVKT